MNSSSLPDFQKDRNSKFLHSFDKINTNQILKKKYINAKKNNSFGNRDFLEDKPLFEDNSLKGGLIQTKEEPGYSMIFFVWSSIVILNCSYGVWAPLLPISSEAHHVPQIYLGFMFASYSVSMALWSPFVGKYQLALGRRNMWRWGLIIVSMAFLGFF